MTSSPSDQYSKYTVMILGAGLGVRLRPVTNGNSPKVMVPIDGDTPLLEHTLTLLKGQGFENFIINLHYLPEKISSYFGNGQAFGVNISYSDESNQLLNTAGAVKKVESSLSDTFLLLYGDMVHFLDFRPILKFHLASNSVLTPILKKFDHPQNVDLAEINPETLEIKQWHFRPHPIQEFQDNLFTNSGLYVVSKKILDTIPSGQPKSLDAEVIPSLLKSGHKLHGYLSPGEILDIGSPDRYEIAKNWYAKQKAKF